LKRETLAAGAICLVLGGLIGYIIGIQTTWKQTREATQTATPAPAVAGTNLPEGHPAITTQADFESLKRAVEAAPNNLTLITELANKLYDASRYEEAVTYYKRSLSLDPGNVNVSTDLGTALFYTGKPDEAIAQFDRSLQIDPRHAQTLHNLVIVNLQGKKDVNAAREALERLRNVDPNNPSISNLQSMILQGSESRPNPRQSLF
jgi:Tfp pilus assembly protein PilF